MGTGKVVDGDIWGGNDDFDVWCLEFETLREKWFREVRKAVGNRKMWMWEPEKVSVQKYRFGNCWFF